MDCTTPERMGRRRRQLFVSKARHQSAYGQYLSAREYDQGIDYTPGLDDGEQPEE